MFSFESFMVISVLIAGYVISRVKINPKTGNTAITPAKDAQKPILKKSLLLTFFLSLPLVLIYVAVVADLDRTMKSSTAGVLGFFLLLPLLGGIFFIFVGLMLFLSIKHKRNAGEMADSE